MINIDCYKCSIDGDDIVPARNNITADTTGNTISTLLIIILLPFRSCRLNLSPKPKKRRDIPTDYSILFVVKALLVRNIQVVSKPAI